MESVTLGHVMMETVLHGVDIEAKKKQVRHKIMQLFGYKCNLGKGSEKKTVFFMVFCQIGGRGVSKGSEKTIMLF